MTQASTVAAPAGFAPVEALAFGGIGQPAVPVDDAHPLPVAPMMMAATSTPLAGNLSASGSVGPFRPQVGRSIWLTLSGTWSGTVAVLRSIDGGTTRLPLTIAGQPWANYAASAQEPIGEESVTAASYYLQVTIASGTLAYRVAQ